LAESGVIFNRMLAGVDQLELHDFPRGGSLDPLVPA